MRFLAAFAFLTSCILGQTKDLSPEELAKLLEKKDKVFFLDVRSPAEIEKLGSVKGYVNIPLDQLEARLKEVPKDKLIVTL
ncbi:MAG TPA: rhodanese-like domain-containing protein [Bryobacteraceae bacterium]|nr:rhodanese-like domain-containing protein [Bryobacteraceae bacterium]